MSDEETRNRAEPYSFVMRAVKCAYCDSFAGPGPEENDIREARVRILFGVYHCAQHAQWAHKDIAAYLARNRLVRLRTVMDPHNSAFPSTRALVSFWDEGPRSLAVRRTCGAVDRAWQINHGPGGDGDLTYLALIDGRWRLPLASSDGEVTKFVDLQWFRDPEVAAAMLTVHDDIEFIGRLTDEASAELAAHSEGLLPITRPMQ
jgi:hypothetical protein